jgi:hypothetical protein
MLFRCNKMPIKNDMRLFRDLPNTQRQQAYGIVNELKFWRTKREPFNVVRIDPIDNELISLYASIQLYEYEKHPDFKHGNPLDNFIGLVGELCVRQAMREEDLSPEYAMRKLNYWDGKDARKFDFKFDKSGTTLEIVTVRPQRARSANLIYQCIYMDIFVS